MIVEAMKMENEVLCTVNATVGAINAKPGELVEPGRPVIELTPSEE
jgi:biotin carboxyl carrier protein